MSVLSIILVSVLMAVEVFLIFTILKQHGSGENLGSIMGGGVNSESYMGKNRVKTKDDKWATGTKISMGLIVAVALLLAVLFAK